MRARHLLLTGLLLLLAACSDRGYLPTSSDPLLGCFATGARKPPDFRIERDDGRYYAAFLRNETWEREQAPLYKATRNDITRYFRDDADQIGDALIRQSGGFGIFHFNKGATLKGKASDSDYMALVLIGAGPVYPVKCD
ncbi:hypothetical protein [Stenotrophomonas sp. 24(2023)]|uniref:hypothetical protein n=1 Tax=Stenotrophomonas sp. 24(2023) TaxID=3068324 RepID=UPI0027E01CFF|nr:hypothetical protein [Stenotrophomonas sp. 24(2023)]WMJ67647.1 hypothetical protein Q9R17_10450 [Stenotrophomonas sp. 24(2023)]